MKWVWTRVHEGVHDLFRAAGPSAVHDLRTGLATAAREPAGQEADRAAYAHAMRPEPRQPPQAAPAACGGWRAETCPRALARSRARRHPALPHHRRLGEEPGSSGMAVLAVRADRAPRPGTGDPGNPGTGTARVVLEDAAAALLVDGAAASWGAAPPTLIRVALVSREDGMVALAQPDIERARSAGRRPDYAGQEGCLWCRDGVSTGCRRGGSSSPNGCRRWAAGAYPAGRSRRFGGPRPGIEVAGRGRPIAQRRGRARGFRGCPMPAYSCRPKGRGPPQFSVAG